MSEGCRNPILGGGGVLVYPAIRSRNFITGVSGYSINKDGSAEFDNLTIRGTFFGADFEFNTNGLFIYSSTPASGNLIASIAAAGGNDRFGNAFKAGFWQQNNSTNLGVQIFSGLVEFFNLAAPPALIPNAQAAGGAAGSGLQVSSGQATGKTQLVATFNDSGLAATGKAELALNGDVHMTAIGNGVRIKEGVNARLGTAVLVAGTVTIANNTITAATRIFAFVQVLGGAAGDLRLGGRTVGSNFTITSSSATETSTIAWFLVEPG